MERTHTIVAAACLALSVSSIGCDPCSTDRASPACVDALASACEEYAHQLCVKRSECQMSQTTMVSRRAPPDECALYIAEECKMGVVLQGAAATPGSLHTCVSAMSAPGCAMLEDYPKECRFPGAKDVDEPCDSNFQCKSESCQYVDWDSYCGTCVEWGTLPYYPEGHACEATYECAPLLICHGGSCTKGAGEGEDCSGNQCNSRQDLHCNTQTHSCEPYQVVEVGQPCGVLDDGSLAACPFDAWCSDEQICVQLPGEGEICGVHNGCDYDTYCHGGGCSQDWNGESWENYCWEGICKKLSLPGEPCGDWDNPGPFCLAPAYCIEGICGIDAEICQ